MKLSEVKLDQPQGIGDTCGRLSRVTIPEENGLLEDPCPKLPLLTCFCNENLLPSNLDDSPSRLFRKHIAELPEVGNPSGQHWEAGNFATQVKEFDFLATDNDDPNQFLEGVSPKNKNKPSIQAPKELDSGGDALGGLQHDFTTLIEGEKGTEIPKIGLKDDNLTEFHNIDMTPLMKKINDEEGSELNSAPVTQDPYPLIGASEQRSGKLRQKRHFKGKRHRGRQNLTGERKSPDPFSTGSGIK